MLRTVCIVAVTVMLCITLGEVAYTLHTFRPHLNVTLENIDRTVIVAGAAAGDIERSARAWEAASKTQATQTTVALSHVTAAANALSLFVSKTDASLNADLIPTATSVLSAQNAALLENQTELRASLQTLRTTISDADKQIASPQIANSLSNIETSTLNLNAGIKNLTGVTADAKDAADYELEQLKKPAKVWLQVLKFVLGYGADARGLFVGYK